MNSNNVDIEQMRKDWIEMGKALGMETLPDDPDNMNKKKTSLDRIHDGYRKGCDMSILGTIILTPFFFFMPSISDEYRISLAITFAIMGLANAYVMYWLWRGIGKINPLTMPITQVSSMAKYYKKCHLQYVLLGSLVAIPWIVYFMIATNRSESVVMGAIIGGICGLYGLWKYMKDYRNLVE
ncbi:MAG: hypothetical protein K2K75_02690 [Muribaculaceae bacterium]|nr:hypothetical protein [Muribaculaceae bacterium]